MPRYAVVDVKGKLLYSDTNLDSAYLHMEELAEKKYNQLLTPSSKYWTLYKNYEHYKFAKLLGYGITIINTNSIETYIFRVIKL